MEKSEILKHLPSDFSEEEIKSAADVRKEIIANDLSSIKSIYMAGEINMQQEMIERCAEAFEKVLKEKTIEFTEWMVENRFISERLITQDTDRIRFMKQYTLPDKREYFSAEELYEQFKNRKG